MYLKHNQPFDCLAWNFRQVSEENKQIVEQLIKEGHSPYKIGRLIFNGHIKNSNDGHGSETKTKTKTKTKTTATEKKSGGKNSREGFNETLSLPSKNQKED